jgi:hypothetical protein
VPAVSAATAIATAGKAVSGGKPDALRVVAQQGGGSAWEVEVLGADGIRHLVTIDGATGAVTGNTVASAGSRGQNRAAPHTGGNLVSGTSRAQPPSTRRSGERERGEHRHA